MIANSMCLACIFSKQEKRVRFVKDEEKKAAFIHDILQLMADYGRVQTNPWLVMKMDEIYEHYFGAPYDYSQIKHKFNQLMLDKEEELEQAIRADDDLIHGCLKYVSAGNYIDFGALEKVNESVLEEILSNAQTQSFDPSVIARFKEDCKNGKTLVYCTDNCGEIVLDKLFIKILKEQYPHLEITVLVRGKPTINDATIEDAEEVGLTDLVPVIGNGYSIPSTVMDVISEPAKQLLMDADVIIAKGQGNFEGLYGEKLNPYFLFLCKCELFQIRFGLEQYSPVFAKEDQIKDVK